MKISKTQHSVLTSAVHNIRTAKKFDFEAWLIKSGNILDPEDPGISDKCREFYRQRFEEAKKKTSITAKFTTIIKNKSSSLTPVLRRSVHWRRRA